VQRQARHGLRQKLHSNTVEICMADFSSTRSPELAVPNKKVCQSLDVSESPADLPFLFFAPGARPWAFQSPAN
jgi:hypothetical protein